LVEFDIDVKTLYAAGERKVGTDEKTFIKILTNKAPWYDQALNVAYKKERGHSLEKAIEKEFSGSLRDLLLALLQPPYEYWADRVFADLHGAGTNDKELVYIFSYFEKNELKLIEQIFNSRHPKHMKDMLKADLSGHYEKAILELLGY